MRIAAQCPGCGNDVEIEPGRRHAEQFCARCDYPLFWVSIPRIDEGDDLGGETTLRRRPGAAGIRLPATLPCPACREPNPLSGVSCLRCGVLLAPEPEPALPEPVPEPEPLPPPEPEPEPAGWPAWVPAAIVGGALLVFLLLVWLLS